MKPDMEDPNNHAPEVSPGDDWDDLDAAVEKSRLGLPPRRNPGGRGLPPKKKAKAATVNRHGTGSIAPRRIEQPDDAPREEVSGEDQPEPKPRKKSAKKAAKKSSRKAAKKTAKKAAKNPTAKTAKKSVAKKAAKSAPPGLKQVEEVGEEQDETDVEGDIRLSTVPSAKPGRLHHTIGSNNPADSDPRPASRPVEKVSAKPKKKHTHTESSDEDVARMRRRFVRGERQDWGEEKGRGSARWMVYTGVGVLIIVVITVALSQMGEEAKTRESDKSLYSQLAPDTEEDVEVTDDLEALEMLTNSQKKAADTYAAFAAATSPSELKEILHNPEEILPLLPKDREPLVTSKDWNPGDGAIWTVLEHEGRRYGTLTGSHPDFSDFLAFFVREGDLLKLDWKATTGYGTASFQEMKTGTGDASEIRARISLADFYTFSLPENEYRSFRLMSPDGDTNLWGYTVRDGELDRKLMKLFTPSQITGEAQSEAQVTMAMEPSPEEGLHNQWLIRELTGLSWLDQK